jgi:hypothetical protein
LAGHWQAHFACADYRNPHLARDGLERASSFHGADDCVQLRLSQFRIHGQRKLGIGESLGHREVAASIPKIRVRFLQMSWNGVVYGRLHAALNQRFLKIRPILHEYRIEMVNMPISS